MAKINIIKEVVMLCGEAEITPFIWGNRGLGKSSIVKQVAIENRMGFVDLRASQIESSDIRGLPEAGDDGRTHYLPPTDMPVGDMTDREITERLSAVLGIDVALDDSEIAKQTIKILSSADIQLRRRYQQESKILQPHFERGILFLDEANRAQDDVLQSIFELVLDRSVGQYVLPPGWIVVAAGNFMEGYMVNGFTDPAFLDRFCHVILSDGEQTLAEWVDYMANVHGELASEIIEFTSHNLDHLDGKIKSELGFNILPSRRSWEMVAKIHAICNKSNKYSKTAQQECYAGLVGRELSIAFSRHSCPVKPRDLLIKGVVHFHPKLTKLNRNQIVSVMWGLVALCKNRAHEEDIATVCLDFADFMLQNTADKDVIVAFCKSLAAGSDNNRYQDRIGSAMVSNPKLASLFSKFNKRKNDGNMTFIDRLSERPELQEIIAKTSWGT
jgi:hypothetical protein